MVAIVNWYSVALILVIRKKQWFKPLARQLCIVLDLGVMTKLGVILRGS